MGLTDGVTCPESSVENQMTYQSVYRELRKRAQYFLSGERRDHTLQPTEIVHEVWLRMKSVNPDTLHDRDEFLAFAGTVMRNLLVDYARSKRAERHGGGHTRVDLPEQMLFCESNAVLILQVDEALKRLACLDERAASVVEMRFFAGLTEDEIARALDVSVRTVARDWGFAKLWMRAQLAQAIKAGEGSGPGGSEGDGGSDGHNPL